MTFPSSRFVRGAVCGILALAPVGIVQAAATPSTGVPLRVVTLNIKDGIGAQGTSRFNDFGDFLTTLDVDGTGPNHPLAPDILHLQEVNPGSGITNIINFRDDFLPGYQLFSANGDGFNLNITAVRPDIQVTSNLSLNTAGPRDIVKLEVLVPEAAKPLVLYNAHFKAGSTTSSRNTRTQEATTSGNNVSFELNFGGPNSDGNVNVIFAGDLNSPNNSDGTISTLFFTDIVNLIPSGIQNLPVETLNGRVSPLTLLTTFPGSGARLDYICLDDELVAPFDTAAPFNQLSQDELNCMGFVYYSSEDGGLRANGNPNATNFATDHRPVVFDVFLPRDPAFPFTPPEDVNSDGTINIEDLYLWENGFAQAAPPLPIPAADTNGNRNVELADRDPITLAVRAAEPVDTTTQ